MSAIAYKPHCRICNENFDSQEYNFINGWICNKCLAGIVKNQLEPRVILQIADSKNKIINNILNTVTKDWSLRQYGSYPDYVREVEEKQLNEIFTRHLLSNLSK